jgi:hypothetical protein
MTDMVLRQFQHCVFVVAGILVFAEFVLAGILPLWFVATIVFYIWGYGTAWRVSVQFRSEFPQAYGRQTVLHYTAWFCFWPGAFGLLILLRSLRTEARSGSQTLVQVNRS